MRGKEFTMYRLGFGTVWHPIIMMDKGRHKQHLQVVDLIHVAIKDIELLQDHGIRIKYGRIRVHVPVRLHTVSSYEI